MQKNNSLLYSLTLCALFLYPHNAWTETDIQRLNFRVEVSPVFVVYADSSRGQAFLGPARLGTNPAQVSIPIVVISNTDQNYQIFLTLDAPPANESGENLPQGEIEFMVSSGQNGGVSAQPNFVPLNPGRLLVFSSSRGTEDRFNLIIRNKNKRILDAGLYYGRISLDVDRS